MFDEGRFLAPVVTWGRFDPEGEMAPMPLSTNIHHAAAEGYHVSRFSNDIQARINTFASTETPAP